LLLNISYADYFVGAQYISFLLGPATVALALPLYRQSKNIRQAGWTVAACLDHGRLELARRLLDEAVEVTAGEGERYWVSELHRLRARLLRAEGAPAGQIAAALDAALEVARGQGARTFEQRALDDRASQLA